MREPPLSSELEALCQQAAIFLRAGKIADAEHIFLELLAFDGQYPKALHLLGIVRLQQGRDAEARDLVAKALGVEPCSANPRHMANRA
jgi:Flp pilus assembly protein TadD